MEHPEEIYKDIDGKELTDRERFWGEGMTRRHAYDLGHEAGYAKCLAEQADPLAGYSNLTEAIKAGKSIDWAKLDGLRTKCVNKTVGTVVGMMDRNVCSSIDEAHGWRSSLMNDIYISAFYAAWSGKNGWTLWIEGEVPLIRKTADQLEVGTYFQGVSPNREIFTLYVGEVAACGQASVHYTPTMIKSPHKASEWEVVEEYGPFQKPEGK